VLNKCIHHQTKKPRNQESKQKMKKENKVRSQATNNKTNKTKQNKTKQNNKTKQTKQFCQSRFTLRLRRLLFLLLSQAALNG
jgi:hypothetical protein